MSRPPTMAPKIAAQITPRSSAPSSAACSSMLLNREGDVGPGLLFMLILAAFIYRRFRNRGQRETRRFVKKASSLKEVRLISFHGGQFTVVADQPTAKSYPKLNALLTAANEKLYRGDPMTLVVREDVSGDELKKILSSPGVQFLRDDDSKPTRRG